MQTVVPSYYKQFSCIADRCKYNCCIGWEIDIDSDTCKKYFELKGSFGDRLRNNIDVEGEPHFVLGETERCPFLNDNNLCDIIINIGEDSLCDICREHPRFSNYFSSRTEIGLGLCCEAAAELVLSYKCKVTFIELGGCDGCLLQEEAALIKDRQQIFDIIQDRTLSIKERVKKLIDRFGVTIPDYSLVRWAEVFLGLEQLEPEWTECLHKLKNPVVLDLDDTTVEQLLVYFIYRHYAAAIDDGRFEERIAFALLSAYIICAVSASCNIDITEAARSYSAEIEYSEENTQQLLEILGR